MTDVTDHPPRQVTSYRSSLVVDFASVEIAASAKCDNCGSALKPHDTRLVGETIEVVCGCGTMFFSATPIFDDEAYDEDER
jgi:hypothetical protein